MFSNHLTVLLACGAAIVLAHTVNTSAYAESTAVAEPVPQVQEIMTERTVNIEPVEPKTAPAFHSLSPVDVISAQKAEEDGIAYDNDAITHAALTIAPDRSELIRLNNNAASIIVGNPQHLSVVADSAQTLVLIPKAPGATFFTVLGKDGDILMQRHVLIAPPKEKYLRIRKTCTNSAQDGCQTTSVYYCPDTCHPILLDDGAASENAAVPDSSSPTYFEDPAGPTPALPSGTEP